MGGEPGLCREKVAGGWLVDGGERTCGLRRQLRAWAPWLNGCVRDPPQVTEAKMAIYMALYGGLGVIHCNNTIEEQVRYPRAHPTDAPTSAHTYAHNYAHTATHTSAHTYAHTLHAAVLPAVTPCTPPCTGPDALGG